MTRARNGSGSALLDHLTAEHDRIWKRLLTPRPVRPAMPPLPQQNIKSIEERIAEAELFHGKIPDYRLTFIKKGIRDSARDCESLPSEGISPKFPSIAEIRKLVAQHFEVSLADIISERRDIKLVRARAVGMHICKELTPRSFPEIGRWFHRDHSTVMHAVGRIKELAANDCELASEIAALKVRLKK